MKKILEILVPLILIVILLACMLNDDGDGFSTEENHDTKKPSNHSKCSGFTVGGLYEGFSAGEDGGDKKATVTMVRADWCGFCKKAKPEWDKFVSEFEGKSLMGHKLHFQDLEESQDKDKISSEYPVKGFPTYFVEIDGKKTEFNSIQKDDMLEKTKSKIKEMSGSPQATPEENPEDVPEDTPAPVPEPPRAPPPPPQPRAPPPPPQPRAHVPQPRAHVPQPASVDDTLLSSCDDRNYGMARLKSVENDLLFSGAHTNIMGYGDCTELEFAPIRTALQDTQPLRAIPRLSDAQLPAPGIDAASGTMRPASFDKPSGVGGAGGKEAHVTMVHADWCGFCKKAKPEWKKLTKKLEGTIAKGYKLIFRDLEQKRDEEEIKNKHPEVSGFPTYVVETKENGKLLKKESFNGITQEAIEKGIHESL